MKRFLKFQYALSALLVIVGLGLLIAAFCVPPVGEIHNSVLIAYGETLTFVGGLLGIDYSYKAKRYINNKDDKENEKDQ